MEADGGWKTAALGDTRIVYFGGFLRVRVGGGNIHAAVKNAAIPKRTGRTSGRKRGPVSTHYVS